MKPHLIKFFIIVLSVTAFEIVLRSCGSKNPTESKDIVVHDSVSTYGFSISVDSTEWAHSPYITVFNDTTLYIYGDTVEAIKNTLRNLGYLKDKK